MEGLRFGKQFKARTDTGLHVVIMIGDEHYVDYDKLPLKLPGIQFVRLEVARAPV